MSSSRCGNLYEAQSVEALSPTADQKFLKEFKLLEQ